MCDFYDERICPQCGSSNKATDNSSWRWNGEHWEHRCGGLDPQVGHFVMCDASTDLEKRLDM